jgi:hypothetical protein
MGCFVFLTQDYCADIAAVVSWDGKVDALNEARVDKLFSGTDCIDVVCIFIGCDDSLPCLFKGFPKLFH